MNFFFHIVLESQMTNHLLFLKTKKMKSIRNLYRILNPKKIYQLLNIIHFYLWKINIIPINKSLQVINSHLMILHILEHFKLNNAKVACTPLPSEYNPASNPKTTTPQLHSCYISVSHWITVIHYAGNMPWHCLLCNQYVTVLLESIWRTSVESTLYCVIPSWYKGSLHNLW